MLVRLAVRYITALSLTIPCVLDKLEVLAGVTEQPWLLPLEFDTRGLPTHMTIMQMTVPDVGSRLYGLTSIRC